MIPCEERNGDRGRRLDDRRQKLVGLEPTHKLPSSQVTSTRHQTEPIMSWQRCTLRQAPRLGSLPTRFDWTDTTLITASSFFALWLSDIEESRERACTVAADPLERKRNLCAGLCPLLSKASGCCRLAAAESPKTPFQKNAPSINCLGHCISEHHRSNAPAPTSCCRTSALDRLSD